MVKSLKSNKGFTLVELIIVIAILAIIMLIAIPNFSGIQQRMQVRADKATAAQIGKAVRVWFTDCSTDSSLVEGTSTTSEGSDTASGTYGPDNIPTVTAASDKAALKPVRYEALKGIEEYITCGQKPVSLRGNTGDDKGLTIANQIYGVFLTEDDTSVAAKVVVAVLSLDASGYTTVKADASPLTAGYDGNGTGIAYIEP